jgi:hypothetical protein
VQSFGRDAVRQIAVNSRRQNVGQTVAYDGAGQDDDPYARRRGKNLTHVLGRTLAALRQVDEHE